MLSESSVAFLKRLLDTPGPSGFEGAPARVWRAEAATFSSVKADVVGNSLATVEGSGGPTILLAGHIDEIGVIVTYIDENGFIYFEPIGGWDPQVLVGQRMRFLGRNGDVFGVIGKKPIHLMKPDEREKASKITDLWVDIGVKNKVEAMEHLEIGDAGVIDARVMEMPNNRIVSRAIDDRIGSLEAGKDADFIILSGDPLSTYTHVEQTWIEGRKSFDRSRPEDRLHAVGGPGAGNPQRAHLCCFTSAWDLIAAANGANQ